MSEHIQKFNLTPRSIKVKHNKIPQLKAGNVIVCDGLFFNDKYCVPMFNQYESEDVVL